MELPAPSLFLSHQRTIRHVHCVASIKTRSGHTKYVASQIIMITFCTSFTLPVNNEIHVDISLFSLVSLDWSKCKVNVTSSPLPSTGPKSFQTTHEPMKGSASRPFYYWARFTAHHSNHHHQIHWQWKGHGRGAADLLANLNECENVDGYWITARSFAIHSRSHSTSHVHIWWPLGIAIVYYFICQILKSNSKFLLN